MPNSTNFSPVDITVREREHRLYSLAYDEAERRLRDGTASSAIIVELLKAGSTQKQEELEKIRNENQWLRTKIENLAVATANAQSSEAVLEALKSYTGGLNQNAID